MRQRARTPRTPEPLEPEPSLEQTHWSDWPSLEFEHAQLCTHTDTRGHRHTDTQEVERIMNILTLTWSVRTPETWLTMEEISEWDAAPARKWSTRDCSMMRSIFASWRFVCDDVD
jgi:hypothetical protein